MTEEHSPGLDIWQNKRDANWLFWGTCTALKYFGRPCYTSIARKH